MNPERRPADIPGLTKDGVWMVPTPKRPRGWAAMSFAEPDFTKPAPKPGAGEVAIVGAFGQCSQAKAPSIADLDAIAALAPGQHKTFPLPEGKTVQRWASIVRAALLRRSDTKLRRWHIEASGERCYRVTALEGAANPEMAPLLARMLSLEIGGKATSAARLGITGAERVAEIQRAASSDDRFERYHFLYAVDERTVTISRVPAFKAPAARAPEPVVPPTPPALSRPFDHSRWVATALEAAAELKPGARATVAYPAVYVLSKSASGAMRRYLNKDKRTCGFGWTVSYGDVGELIIAPHAKAVENASIPGQHLKASEPQAIELAGFEGGQESAEMMGGGEREGEEEAASIASIASEAITTVANSATVQLLPDSHPELDRLLVEIRAAVVAGNGTEAHEHMAELVDMIPVFREYERRRAEVEEIMSEVMRISEATVETLRPIAWRIADAVTRER